MSERVKQANGRLRSAKVGVTIDQIGQRLYLKATLPPRPSSSRTIPHQQRIALGVLANPAGVSYAEKEARKVGALLACKEFSWEPYLSPQNQQPSTIGDWVRRLENELRQTVSEITWTTDYQNVFKKLDHSQPLTAETLRDAILKTQPNTKTRRRYCLTLTRLAQFAEVECDFKPLQGNYSSKQVDPRQLPSDAAIAQGFYSIKNPGWRWVYGMIATFGLRGHEVFYLDTSDFEQGQTSIIRVLEGKTGRRLIWPFYPEWIDEFGLRQKQLPSVTGKKHSDFTMRVSKYLGKTDLTFTALDMRHCWAVRALEFGLDISLAAQQMGHSVKVHSETYHHWITADVHQRAFEALTKRDGRPQAPQIDLA